MRNKILLIATGFACTICFFSCLKEESLDEIYRPAGTEIAFSAANSYESEEELTRVDFTGPDSLFFETAASGEAEAETRTIFTGSGAATTGVIERIDWVNGDRMSISYQRQNNPTQTGIYQVTSGVAGENGTVDNAGVDFISGTKLTWGEGSGDHYFYAVYPAHGQSNCTFAPVATGADISGEIPSSQSVKYSTYNSQTKYLPEDMTRCYMVGYLAVDATGSTSRVTIPFVPAVTMFEFSLQRPSGKSGILKVRKATLSAANIAGPFSLKLTGGNDPRSNWMTNISAAGGTGTGSIEITFKNSSGASAIPEISSSSALNFTVLANPIAYANLVLTLELSEDGTNYYTKKLTLEKSGGFPAFKKHIITNSNVPDGNWEYTFEHVGGTTLTTTIGGNITPYQEIYRSESSAGDTGTADFNSYLQEAGSGETQYAVSYTVAYAPDNNGTPGTFTSNFPTGVTGVPITPNSSTNTIKGTWNANSGTSIPSTTIPALRKQNMQSKGSYGTSDAPQDLSLCTVASSGITTRSSGPTTANCYIIDRPGYYMFPLVYGNAIVNGNPNSSSYTKSTTETNTWQSLHRHDGQAITSPYILQNINGGATTTTNMTADYVWQDKDNSSDPLLITNIAVFTPSGAAVQSSYIKFYVNPDNIRPGNAVIALKKSGTIVWSWHIWLTDGVDTDGNGTGDGFPTVQVNKNPNITSAKASNLFLQIPLGTCETGTVSGTAYNERAGWVRVTQDGSGNQLYFRIVQRGDMSGVTVSDLDLSPTFYQWGRKDPFVPRKSGTDNVNKDCALNSLSSPITGDSHSYSSASNSIQHPTYFYHKAGPSVIVNGTSCSDISWLSEEVYNLWNMNQLNSDGTDCTVTKTVYDPCPPGFSLPNLNAFKIFTVQGGKWKRSEDESADNVNTTGTGAPWNDGYSLYTQYWHSGPDFYFRAYGWRKRETGNVTMYNGDRIIMGVWTSYGGNGGTTKAYVSKGFSCESTRVYPAGEESISNAYPVLPAVQ